MLEESEGLTAHVTGSDDWKAAKFQLIISTQAAKDGAPGPLGGLARTSSSDVRGVGSRLILRYGWIESCLVAVRRAVSSSGTAKTKPERV